MVQRTERRKRETRGNKQSKPTVDEPVKPWMEVINRKCSWRKYHEKMSKEECPGNNVLEP